MTNVQTPLETFSDMSLRYACFIDEAFSGKKNFWSWDHSRHVTNYQVMDSRNFGVLAVFPDKVNSETQSGFDSALSGHLALEFV